MMSFIVDIFKPAPFIEPIRDTEVVNKSYHYWRIRILYSMFIGYAFYYFTRKSFTFAMPGLVDELGFDKGQLGLLGSVFSVTYGLSKFASGVISDQSNPRFFMAAGLIMTGIVNILFGMSSSIMMFALFWGLNGWFQGCGWPPCARFLTHWYSHSERGSWWSIWNVSHNVGAFIIPWIAGGCLHYLGWRYAMYVPGVLCIFAGAFLINRLRDTPQSLGLPPIEEFRNDYGSNKAKSDDNEQISTKRLVIDYILKNKFMWILAMAYFFVYFVRTGINDWTALYLIEAKDYSRIGANGCVSMFEVGGFFGSLSAGWSSDRLFGARRGPVNVIFATAMFLAIILFWWVPEGYLWMDSLAIFLMGFAIFGPQMMIGIAAAELSHKKAASTSTGFVGFFAYIGAAIAGYPLGKIAQEWGWEGFFVALIVCCLISIMLLLLTWNAAEGAQEVLSRSSSSNKAQEA